MMYVSFLTVVDCGALTDPANGQVSHTAGTTFGETATYTCDAGYNLVGDSNHTCRATGVWSGCAPTCQGMLLVTSVVLRCSEYWEGVSGTHCFLLVTCIQSRYTMCKVPGNLHIKV